MMMPDTKNDDSETKAQLHRLNWLLDPISLKWCSYQLAARRVVKSMQVESYKIKKIVPRYLTKTVSTPDPMHKSFMGRKTLQKQLHET